LLDVPERRVLLADGGDVRLGVTGGRRRSRVGFHLRRRGVANSGPGQQGEWAAHRPVRYSPSFALNKEFSTPGLPLPFRSFIAWPTKKPSRFTFPALYLATSPALRAMTASTTASSAELSLTCATTRRWRPWWT